MCRPIYHYTVAGFKPHCLLYPITFISRNKYKATCITAQSVIHAWGTEATVNWDLTKHLEIETDNLSDNRWGLQIKQGRSTTTIYEGYGSTSCGHKLKKSIQYE